MDINALTRAYVAIRDARSERKKEFDAIDTDLKDKMARLEAALLQELQTQKAKSISTDSGTVYMQEDLKPSCSDWSALDAWEKANPDINASDILEKRVSKKFITEYMDANDGALPPGVSIYREYVARVRRS